jgi:hypothetical protein
MTLSHDLRHLPQRDDLGAHASIGGRRLSHPISAWWPCQAAPGAGGFGGSAATAPGELSPLNPLQASAAMSGRCWPPYCRPCHLTHCRLCALHYCDLHTHHAHHHQGFLHLIHQRPPLRSTVTSFSRPSGAEPCLASPASLWLSPIQFMTR